MSEASRAGSGRAQGRVGTAINGKWTVDARLGAGGMATVYAATHRNGHRAALKVLHAQLSREPAVRARFLREAYVANAVDHPGVVSVLDDDVSEDGSAFLVLELLEGETIETRRLRQGGALPVDEMLDIADSALDALAAAHEKGIVHRDVKPENVFLTTEGVVKLLDFGLAQMKDAAAEATKTGVTIGTPEFMPPEQALGRRDGVDARSDVWGLGATLFTSITGQYVHSANSLHEQLQANATRRARPLRSVAPHVSSAVAMVVDRALELEKSDRWPSAREMQRALRDARGRGDGDAPSLTVPVGVPSPRGLSETFAVSDSNAKVSDRAPRSGETLRDRVAPPPPPAFGITTAPLHAPLANQANQGSQPPPPSMRPPMPSIPSYAPPTPSGAPPAMPTGSRALTPGRIAILLSILVVVICVVAAALIYFRSIRHSG